MWRGGGYLFTDFLRWDIFRGGCEILEGGWEIFGGGGGVEKFSGEGGLRNFRGLGGWEILGDWVVEKFQGRGGWDFFGKRWDFFGRGWEFFGSSWDFFGRGILGGGERRGRKSSGGYWEYSGGLRNFHGGLKIIFLRGGGGLDIFFRRCWDFFTRGWDFFGRGWDLARVYKLYQWWLSYFRERGGVRIFQGGWDFSGRVFRLFLETWTCFRIFSGGVGIFSVVLKLNLFSRIKIFIFLGEGWYFSRGLRLFQRIKIIRSELRFLSRCSSLFRRWGVNFFSGSGSVIWKEDT